MNIQSATAAILLCVLGFAASSAPSPPLPSAELDALRNRLLATIVRAQSSRAPACYEAGRLAARALQVQRFALKALQDNPNDPEVLRQVDLATDDYAIAVGHAIQCRD